MGAPAAAPRKRTTAKKATPGRKPAAGKAPDGTAGAEPAAPPPQTVDDGRSVNQWLHDLNSKPLRVEVFDQWWEFKPATGARAVAWDTLLRTKGIRAALSSMMFDETTSPEQRWTDADGVEHVLEALPGSAAADRFVNVANQWVTPEAAQEFWRRMELAIFAGEASAS